MANRFSFIIGSLFTSKAATTTLTVPTNDTLTCYTCIDCDEPFNSNNVATVTVPAN
ncbi:unnamed protein product, partial [Rotaria sp. Silwood2]